MSAKLGQTLRDGIRVRQKRLSALAHEGARGCRERCTNGHRLESADVGIAEFSKGVSGKVVVAARLHRGEPFAEASKRKRVIAHRADVVLGLPDATALDARARMQRIDDAPPEEVRATGGAGESSSPAVSPNSSRNRGPAGRNCAAGVMERSNCSASGSRNTR
jgi:hypothetical protein